jgi:DNA-binding IclR family transcriptional regulator
MVKDAMGEAPTAAARAAQIGSSPRQPLSKAIKVLTWMVDYGGEESSVREIAAALDIPVTSVYRATRDLEAEKLVERTPDGRYRLGFEFLRLSARAGERGDIRRLAMPVLQELKDSCLESVFFGMYDRDRHEMIFAASVESELPFRYVIKINQWMTPHCGASGLGIFAFLTPDERAAAYDAVPMVKYTPDTLVDRDRLEELIIGYRAKGYVFTRNQRVFEAYGVSAPVFDATSEVIGDIMITVPAHRFPEHSEERLAAATIQAARKLTRDIGGRPPEWLTAWSSSPEPTSDRDGSDAGIRRNGRRT